MKREINMAIERALKRRRAERQARRLIVIGRRRVEKWPPENWTARFNKQRFGNC